MPTQNQVAKFLKLCIFWPRTLFLGAIALLAIFWRPSITVLSQISKERFPLDVLWRYTIPPLCDHMHT